MTPIDFLGGPAYGESEREKTMANQRQAASLAAIEAAHNARAEIGLAWQALAHRLDGEWPEWQRPLLDWAIDAPGFLVHLRDDPSVLAGGDAAERLLVCGLTPSMLYEAFDNMRLLFNRARRKHAADEDGEYVLLRLDDGSRVPVAESRIRVQVAGVRDLLPGIHRPGAQDISRVIAVTNWIMRLLEFHPFIIDGYAFDPVDRSFYQVDASALEGVAARWCKEPAFILR
jgi:hypothetical protein